MAERKERKGGLEFGFFYYDWALSRYRWTDENCFHTVSGLGPVKKVVHPSSDVKVGGKPRFNVTYLMYSGVLNGQFLVVEL